MLVREPMYKRAIFWQIAIPLLLVILWIALFYPEFSAVYRFLVGQAAFTGDPLLDTTLRESLAIAALSVTAFVVYLVLSLWAVSQFVLPIQLPSERLQVFGRLLRHIFGMHGPAVFIREGVVMGSQEELQSSRPGVAFVDLASAIVLERQPLVSGRSGSVSTFERRRRRKRRQIATEVGEIAPLNGTTVRSAGPGIVFTEAGEKIRGAVSLRRHFRLQGRVKSITRDGFEIYTPIITIFTLGEPPEVLRVGYFGATSADLRILKVDEKEDKPTQTKQTILRGLDELDDADREEIHLYAQRNPSPPETNQQPLESGTVPKVKAPYTFDAERVFKAVYAEARKPSDNTLESWQDLPIKVAAEIFHSMIGLQYFSELYKPKDAVDFPLAQTFRPEFSRRVRNQGVLAFQLVRRKDGQSFSQGQPYDPEDVIEYPVRPLRNNKVLRDRGIRIIAASFPEIQPVNPAVRQQLLDYWRAKWQRESNKTLAPYIYDQVKVRAAARVQAQKDIVKSLSEIMQDKSVSREIITVRVLQALEAFAKEPAAMKMVPYETIQMLSRLQEWVGPPAGSPKSGSPRDPTFITDVGEE